APWVRDSAEDPSPGRGGLVGRVRLHAGFLPDPRPVRPRRPLRRGRLQRPRIQALSRSGPAPGRIRRDGTSAGGAGGVASVPVRGRPAGPARRALPPTGPTTPIVRGLTALRRRGEDVPRWKNTNETQGLFRLRPLTEADACTGLGARQTVSASPRPR